MLLRWDRLILLSTINNVFYILNPENDSKISICDKDNKKCFSFEAIAGDNKISVASLPKNATQFKLRAVYQNHTIRETAWRAVLTNRSTTTPTMTTPRELPTQDQHIKDLAYLPLIYYITICSSLLVAKLFIEIVNILLSTRWNIITRVF